MDAPVECAAHSTTTLVAVSLLASAVTALLLSACVCAHTHTRTHVRRILRRVDDLSRASDGRKHAHGCGSMVATLHYIATTVRGARGAPTAAFDAVEHAPSEDGCALPVVPVTRGIAHAVTHTRTAAGSIALVGAGPGSPDLLTVAAYHAIASADVVICDRIAPAALRSIAAASATFLVAAKLPGRADAAQEELNAWGIQALQAGKRVVRLKAGDPYVYGRGGEEFEFYASRGFVPDVIPGISSAFVAPLVAGIPVTHRGVASQVLISTGHGRNGALPDLPAYDASRTLVLLMAVGRMSVIQAQLLERGYPATTPVAVIERATHVDERCTRSTLEQLPADAAAAGCAAPAVILVGGVVNAVPDAI